MQLGVGRGSPEQVLDGWKYFGYDYSEEEIKEVTRERTLEFLELLEGKHLQNQILNQCSHKDQENYGSNLIQKDYDKESGGELVHSKRQSGQHNME